MIFPCFARPRSKLRSISAEVASNPENGSSESAHPGVKQRTREENLLAHAFR